MEQRTFASQGSFERYGRKSRRELFLDEMELVVPWSELQGLVEPHYAKAGNGRRPVGLALMLRTYFLQQWFNLSETLERTMRVHWTATGYQSTGAQYIFIHSNLPVYRKRRLWAVSTAHFSFGMLFVGMA